MARLGLTEDEAFRRLRRAAMDSRKPMVEIARALGADARILIMDEPTASLSDTEVENLFRVIRELKTHEVGIIYISHRLEELPEVARSVGARIEPHTSRDPRASADQEVAYLLPVVHGSRP